MDEYNLESVRVEADTYWKRPDGKYDFNFKLLPAAYKWCYSESCRYLRYEYDVIVSNTFTTIKEMNPYIEYAKALNHEVKIYRCTGEYQNIHNVPQETLLKMKERFCDIEGEIYVENF